MASDVRYWRKAVGFFQYVGRRFFEERCPLWAGMLTYASLLALVPLVVVMVSVAAAFPVFDRWTGQVESFIFSNFIPAAGNVAHQYLADFVERARSLSPQGVIFLVVSALLLMFSMDTIVNHIWRVRSRRTLGAKFLVYWSVLTVGPMLMGASIVVSLKYAPRLEEAVASAGARGVAFRVLPWAISTLAFTLIYFFVPFVRVRWRHALSGGVLSALLFELAKFGFRLYLHRFPAYEAIYGAFSVVPIFLIWIYLCWTVLLIGACFSTALGSYRPAQRERARPEDEEIFLVLRLLRHLWMAQHRGLALTEDHLLDAEPEIGEGWLDEMLQRLSRCRWIESDAEDGFRLARDLKKETLVDLCRSVPIRLPAPGAGADSGLDSLRRAFAELGEPLDKILGGPLEAFFDDMPQEEAPKTVRSG